MAKLLEVKDLTVSIGGRKLLNGLTFGVEPGETVALFGPNGAGKSSLLFTLLGFPRYRVEKGSILFKGKDITDRPTNERVKLGLGVSFQSPPRLRGVTLRDMLRIVGGAGGDKVAELARQVRMESFLARDVNLGFSGGEMKRAEVLQMGILQPEMAILDETDSGLDIDALRTVAEGINALADDRRGFLIITHYQRILNYVRPHHIHVLFDGRIIKSGGPELALELEAEGYERLIGEHAAAQGVAK